MSIFAVSVAFWPPFSIFVTSLLYTISYFRPLCKRNLPFLPPPAAHAAALQASGVLAGRRSLLPAARHRLPPWPHRRHQANRPRCGLWPARLAACRLLRRGVLRNTSQKALSRRVYAPLRCAQTLREKSPFLRSVASQSLLAAPGLRLAGVRSLARLGVPKARRARPGCGCAAAALPAGGARSGCRRRGARALPALISAPLQTTPGHIDRGKRIAWGMISPGRQASGPPAGDAGGCVCGRSA